MIVGHKIKNIVGYLPIDHNSNGLGWVGPGEGERFIGHPYGYHCDNSIPFIEVLGDNQTLRTINVLDVSEIEFETESEGV